MTALVIEKQETTPSVLSAWKYRILGATAATSAVAVPYASAAINFSPIQELLTEVVDLIPTFMDLVGQFKSRLTNGGFIGRICDCSIDRDYRHRGLC
jgi:hypothetical protein